MVTVLPLTLGNGAGAEERLALLDGAGVGEYGGRRRRDEDGHERDDEHEGPYDAEHGDDKYE